MQFISTGNSIDGSNYRRFPATGRSGIRVARNCWRRGFVIPALAVLSLFSCLATAMADDADAFFDESYVHEIHLTFEDSDWYNTLYTAYVIGDDDFYLPCRWDYMDGAEVITVDPIGARFKGHSSFWDSGEKKSFKIDFNELDPEGTFLGLKKLNLNNNFRDPTMLREKLFLDFVTAFTPAHRAVFVRVIINGEPWGIFTAAEQIDGTFCDRLYGESEDGNLYKGEYMADLNYWGDDPATYAEYYEKKTNESLDDWTDLIAVIDALNNTPDGDFDALLPIIMDTDAMVWQFAATILFVNLDAYIGPAHNYYLYHRDFDGRFVHLLWDCNMAFATYTSYFPDTFDMTGVPLVWRDTTGYGRPLADRSWNSPLLVRNHYRALARMLREGFSSEVMDSRIDELADIIREDVYADTRKDYTNEEFEQGLANDVGRAIGLKRFVADRHDFVKTELDELAMTSDIRLNELMAVNAHSITDSAGDHDPWLELYNLGPGLVTTTGMYLTDEISVPDKWRLPSLDIQDGGFEVLWMDSETIEGVDHAPFSLDPQGGELFLHIVTDEYALIDTVEYPPLPADSVWGRWPDGSGGWMRLPYGTAGAANVSPTAGLNLFINEFMAANTSVYPDEAGEHEDWLELHNAGTEPVNLAGMYLTDSLYHTTKWMIPDLVVTAGGFLVFFCDDDEEQGDLHTNFKLSKEGGAIGLYGADGVTAIDSLTYAAQSTNISCGRCPDGGTDWAMLGEGTPGATNNSACPTSDGMTLFLEDRDLVQGDLFDLHFTLGPHSGDAVLDAYILLGVGDSYWCWPSWQPLEEGLDFQRYDMPAWTMPAVDALVFEWPYVDGSFTGLYFYGAAFQAGTFDLVGAYQVMEFGYR
ncbi:CotH kinase family protein [bacterium]|nr:CotH kinase family protein [candidate division CSSED10-310 bacterium]